MRVDPPNSPREALCSLLQRLQYSAKACCVQYQIRRWDMVVVYFSFSIFPMFHGKYKHASWLSHMFLLLLHDNIRYTTVLVEISIRSKK